MNAIAFRNFFRIDPKRHLRRFSGLALIATTMGSQAWAAKDCDLSFIVRPSTNIDFTTTARPLNYTVEVTRGKRNRSCTFGIGFGPGQGSGGSFERKLAKGSSTIRYGIFSAPCTPTTPNCTNIQLKDETGATSLDEALVGQFQSNSGSDTQSLAFYPTFPLEHVNNLATSSQLKPWGVYTDRVQVKLFEGGATAGDLVASSMLSLSVTIPRFATVSIVSKGAPYSDPPVATRTVDFGALTANEIQEFDLISLYNAGYNLSIASENGGRLRGSNGPATIPYEFFVDSALKNLTANSSVSVAVGSGVSPAGQGRRNQIRVRIPASSLTNAMGGTYQDTLTVTITSTE